MFLKASKKLVPSHITNMFVKEQFPFCCMHTHTHTHTHTHAHAHADTHMHMHTHTKKVLFF